MLKFLILSMFISGALVLVLARVPVFGIFGVLIVALSHAVLLAVFNMSFFSLLILIIYAGGMLIVFLFATILSVERFPVFIGRLFFPIFFGALSVLFPFVSDWNWSHSEWSLVQSSADLAAVINIYNDWGLALYVVGGALLGALLITLSLNFEQGNKSLRRL